MYTKYKYKLNEYEEYYTIQLKCLGRMAEMVDGEITSVTFKLRKTRINDSLKIKKYKFIS